MAHRDGDRLYLLHLVRSFALEHSDDGERDRLSARLVVRMRKVAEGLRDGLRSSGSSTRIDEYLARLPDFRRALDISLSANDADTALRIVGSLRDLALNSSTSELGQWAEEAATAGERVDHPLTVDGYAIAGLGAWKRGSLHDTRRLLALGEAVVDRTGLEPTYELLGAQATEDLAHGALDQAIERLERAALLPGVVDDPIRRAETYGTLVICMAYAHRSDVIGAADELAAGIVGEPAEIARAWSAYASGECRLAVDDQAARHHLERAVDLARLGGSTFIEGIAGASLASIDVRSDDPTAAIADYRWLLPLWLRAGMQSPFWTGMRAVADMLARAGENISAVRLLGAVMAPGTGHDVFGDDAARLESVSADLERQVGSETFQLEFARGAGLDEAAAAQEATTAFDRLTSAAP